MHYVFPETGDHTIEWIGRRYMLLKADGIYKIELWQAADVFVETDAVDYVLLDGLECMPFATLLQQNKGRIAGKLIVDNDEEVYRSLEEAKRELIKKWRGVQAEQAKL